jgi:acyl-CoA thioester hydrolase
MRPEPFRLDPATYPTWVRVSTRESDVDGQGHVNSLWLGFLFRESWTDLQLRVVGGAERARFERLPDESVRDRRFLVARITFDYLREIFHPSTVQVGAGVLAIGRSSLTIGCGMFQEGVVSALADYTVVHADADGPLEWPDHVRERARSFAIGTSPPGAPEL